MYTSLAFKKILNVVFPPCCLGCGQSDSYGFCSACLTKIPIKKGFSCVGCGVATLRGAPCAQCEDVWNLDYLYYATEYSQPLMTKVIKAYKYRFIKTLLVPLSHLAIQYLKNLKAGGMIKLFDHDPLLVPVPLYLRRLRWRGFNQAELISRRIAESFSLDHSPECLVKTKAASPQAEKENKNERLRGVNDCFACVALEKVKGRHILLVDDICTTGATLNECAKVLKAAGAISVTGFTIARG